MEQTVIINNRSPRLRTGRRARLEPEWLAAPLQLEMALHFNCQLRKRVHAHDLPDGTEARAIGDHPQVWFRPVVTKTRAVRECEPCSPPGPDMPRICPQRYFPRGLAPDCRRAASDPADSAMSHPSRRA